MRVLDLSGSYRLRAEFLDEGAERFQEVLNHADCPGQFMIHRTNEHRKKHPNTYPLSHGTIEAKVPCDVITALVENKLIEDPLKNDNARDLQWLCDLSWWFIKEFTIEDDFLMNDEIHLFFEMLDYKADIILNGIIIGHHKNSFRPFDKNIKNYLMPGNNRLIIRLTGGTEDYLIQDSVSYYCATDNGTKNQRSYLRKPQYTYGWDWCPSVPTCGIGGRIELQGKSGAEISAFRADTIKIEDYSADIHLYFEIDKTIMEDAEDAVLNYCILQDGKKIIVKNKELYLSGGLNFIDEYLTIKNARLWWPNGNGEQYQYSIQASVICRNITNQMELTKFGIRTFQIRQERIDENSRSFDLYVNGCKTFMRGGNWVPPASTYLSVSDRKYKNLVEEASNANFNMLRVWGGGLFAPDCFYEYCSEKGIMIMQDFMYSCAFYPDQADWFLFEAETEATYQTKRLAHYPCIAIWSGNNEEAESWTDWWVGDLHSQYNYGSRIFNYLQPLIVRNNCPNSFYMPSSPYFGSITEGVVEGTIKGVSSNLRWCKHANNPLFGDTHAWNYFLNDPETKYKANNCFEVFDIFPARFLSEYGFWGPISIKSMYSCISPDRRKLCDSAWTFHGEITEKHEMILGQIESMFMNTKNISVEQYAILGAVSQGILYGKLAESMREKQFGSGFLTWMFNDAWPETGWSQIDYYGNRKACYYYLRHAFSPRIMILKKQKQKDILCVLNETERDLQTDIIYGSMNYDGKNKKEYTISVRVQAHENKQYDIEANDKDSEFTYAVTSDCTMECCTDVVPYYRKLDLVYDDPIIVDDRKMKQFRQITVRSDVYIPCVVLTSSNEETVFDDNYFELIPGNKKIVRISGNTGMISAKNVMNITN